jgi:hypothetical protein
MRIRATRTASLMYGENSRLMPTAETSARGSGRRAGSGSQLAAASDSACFRVLMRRRSVER